MPGKLSSSPPPPTLPPPVITSPQIIVQYSGEPISYQITADEPDCTFNVSGLPEGLEVNGSGLITGSIVADAPFTATLSATNSEDTTGPNFDLSIFIVVPGQSFSILVNKGPDRFLGYWPPHGRFVKANGVVSINGDLKTALLTSKRYSARTSVDAIDSEINSGLIELYDAIDFFLNDL